MVVTLTLCDERVTKRDRSSQKRQLIIKLTTFGHPPIGCFPPKAFNCLILNFLPHRTFLCKWFANLIYTSSLATLGDDFCDYCD